MAKARAATAKKSAATAAAKKSAAAKKTAPSKKTAAPSKKAAAPSKKKAAAPAKKKAAAPVKKKAAAPAKKKATAPAKKKAAAPAKGKKKPATGKRGLKGQAAPDTSSGRVGKVDPAAGLGDDAVLAEEEGGEELDAMLTLVDITQNMDKWVLCCCLNVPCGGGVERAHALPQGLVRSLVWGGVGDSVWSTLVPTRDSKLMVGGTAIDRWKLKLALKIRGSRRA